MWSWDWSEPFSVPGLLWGLVTSVLVPAFAIVAAVWVGNRQVKATVREQLDVLQREEARHERERETKAEEQVYRGVELSLGAMHDLVQAGFTIDIQQRVLTRIDAARKNALIVGALRSKPDSVRDWVTAELGIVSQALEEIDEELGLPLQLERVVWRSGHFLQILTNWQSGVIDDDWFETAEHKPIEETAMPGDEDEPEVEE